MDNIPRYSCQQVFMMGYHITSQLTDSFWDRMAARPPSPPRPQRRSLPVVRPRRALVGPTRTPPLPLPNLLNDIETLGTLLVDHIAAGDQLNAFLIAAGMRQIAEDYLHRDPFHLRRAAGRLQRRLPARWGWIGIAAARWAGSLAWQCVIRMPGHRASVAWLERLEGLAQQLAVEMVESSGRRGLATALEREAEARELLAELPRLPTSVRRGLLRPPSCFRSFDQAPADLEVLAASFARCWPEVKRPILV